MSAVCSATLLGSPVYQLAWFFLLYSFCGVVIEGLFFLVHERVLESRVGLLYLPLRPLYGVGGMAYTLLLRPVVEHPVLLFLLGAVVGTVVEYVASVLTERAFGAVSWDYSDKVLNLRGRVCLQYSACWGLLALLALYGLDRPLTRLVDLPGRVVGDRVLTGAMVLVLVSSVLTLAALRRVRQRVDLLRAEGNGTRTDRLVDRLAPDRVLINTFPRMSLMTELMELTGRERAWLRLPGRPGLPSTSAAGRDSVQAEV